MKETVIEKISKSAGAVSDKVVNTIVDAEIERRASIILVALAKVDEVTAQRKKIESPDDVRYDLDKKEVRGFTPKRIAEQKKLDETVANLNKAIELCLTENTEESYDKLGKLYVQAHVAHLTIPDIYCAKSQGAQSQGGGEAESKA